MKKRRRVLSGIVPALVGGALLAGCSPKVKVEPPTEPITINLNVKIDHEVRVKVDRELDHVYQENPDVF
jgi:hypothetical protein